MMTLIAEKMTEVLGVVFLHIATEHLVTERKMLKSALSHSTVFRSRRLRVSMSQLLSIKVDDKFLLIPSAKRGHLTPIGGVVRYFPSEVSRLEGGVGFEHEYKKGPERYDLRGYVRGQNFHRFMRWYASGTGREQSALTREIEEEFIEIGIPSISSYVKRPEFVRDRIIHEGPSEIRNGGYWQYRYFEIFSLREESDVSRQLAEFIRSQVGKNPKLVLVTTAEIKKGITEDRCNFIGDSCGYLFSDSAHGIIPPPLL